MTEESLFHHALGQPAERRAAFLEQVCAGDEALRRRLEALLHAPDHPASFLRQPPAHPAAIVAAPPPAEAEAAGGPARDEGPGGRIGPYKLLQRLGEGGMGAVWMAEQREPVQRQVALKIIKPGLDSDHVLARFEAERQALALMDHPHIARVLDAGTTASGRPYFVMELVKGVPLTKFCDERRLTPRQRLELFIPVCQAVQHAHTKGIIHRDLKPSNVLIALYDGKPAPKVIDFGVAKAMGPKLTDKTLFTEFGAVVGTLEYMSPEQAELNNLDIDTRSDVYSLGVLLYELLTGTTPLEREALKEVPLLEVLRVIREEDPPTPSNRLSTTKELASIAANRGLEPRKLGGLVRGELDWIVMRALEKDRARRYETANGLVADIRRYLQDEPVQACPPSAGYRLRKFVRRHRGPVLAASLVVLALLGGMAGTTAGLFWAEMARQAEAEQRRLAQANEQKALAAAEAEATAKQTAQLREAETKAVLNFVVNRIIAAARPEGKGGGLGRDVTLRQALEEALAYVDRSFTKQPLIEARLRTTLGESFRQLGDYDRAAEQHQRAYTLYARHCGPDDADTLGSISNLALSYAGLGRRAEAVKLYEKTLARMRIRIPNHPFTFACMNNLALSYADLGRRAEAVKLFEEALALQKANLGPDDPATLMTTGTLGHSYKALRRHAEAVKLCEEALARQRATLGAKHPDTLTTMSYLANCYTAVNRHDEAIKLHEESLALKKATLGPDDPNTLMGMHNLANSYSLAGRHAEALKLREETLALRRDKLGPNHPDTLMSEVVVAVTLDDLGRSAEAVPLIDDCLKRVAGKTIDPRIVPAAIEIGLRHFEKRNDAADCRTTAELWEQFRRTDAESLYSAACWRAVTAAVQAKTPGADAARLAGEDADRAMAWLKQAVAAGYKDAAQVRDDRDLEALRGREDFKKLLAELEPK
jgi:serine/threonine protein kinase/tetratricopeptide (TPR) repeat protein